MSFLHTLECIKSEFNLFSLPPTQTSIESSQWIYYKPITLLADDSPIVTSLYLDMEKIYLDLTHTTLSLRVESERRKSTSVAPDRAKVELVNHLLHFMFMFNQIDVYFN